MHSRTGGARHGPWATGLAFGMLFAGLAAVGWLQRGAMPAEAIGISVLLAGLLAWGAAVDAHRFFIPDTVSLGLLPLGLAATWLLDPSGLVPHLVAAVGAGVVLLLVSSVYRMARGREGLGMGDIKLFAAAGAWVGPAGLPGVLLTASLCAIVALLVRRARGRRVRRLPFGPFLAIGFWTVWIFGPVALMP